MTPNRRLAILLSGRGSNFLAIHDAIQRGDLRAEICLVLSNVSEAPGLRLAEDLKLNAACIPSRDVARGEYDRRVTEVLRAHDPVLICLAGFMRVLTSELVEAFRDRIVNIHPALLPAFPGLHAQRQALDWGAKVAGCTVHLVDEGVDTGPIVLQSVVPVNDDDTEETLSARILEQEHQTYWRAISLLLDGRIHRVGRRLLTS